MLRTGFVTAFLLWLASASPVLVAQPIEITPAGARTAARGPQTAYTGAAIAELLHDVLDDAGYLPIVILDPETVVETIKRTSAGIVLLDIMMPRRNGWEVLEDLRADSATHEIPVVLTSAVYDRIGRRPLPIGGPIRFAAKPFDINDLLGTIEALIERHVRGAGVLPD